jgi:DNA-binding transcriptional regulator YiaG
LWEMDARKKAPCCDFATVAPDLCYPWQSWRQAYQIDSIGISGEFYMLESTQIHLTSTPPIGETSKLIATLPPNITGAHLTAVRHSAGMSRNKFATLCSVSGEWLRLFERGTPATLSKCSPQTQAGVAQAMKLLGVRLTKDGWVLLQLPPKMEADHEHQRATST